MRPVRWIPKTIRIKPASLPKSLIFESSICPIHVAVAPSNINVIEKPIMNMMEFSRTVRRIEESFCCALSCSSEEPEMIER